MNLSISNIAWDLAEDNAMADLLTSLGVSNIEVAPTKIWPLPLTVTQEEIVKYRNFWDSHGVRIVALQSLLFGKPNLELFRSKEVRDQTIDYLMGMIELAGHVGARILVFGSPKNRLAGHCRASEVMDIALEFFSILAKVSQKYDVCLCIEPNPPHYGCDFIRNTSEGIEIVKLVNHPNFRLHLDAGAMILNNEPFEKAIEESFPWLAHFHMSEPNLCPPGKEAVAHARIAQTLRKLGYNRYISIEMLNREKQSNLLIAKTALEFAMNTYL